MNRGILGHYVATASLATGVYETLNNFASVPPDHPTVFEYFRKDLKRPSSDAWVVAPSNGFNRIGESDDRSYGAGMGARVILPKHLLRGISGRTHRLQHLLRDNYEDSLSTPRILPAANSNYSSSRKILRALGRRLQGHAQTLSSPDELSIYVVRQLMRHVAQPALDHAARYRHRARRRIFAYVEGIRRTDRLCPEFWNAIQADLIRWQHDAFYAAGLRARLR